MRIHHPRPTSRHCLSVTLLLLCAAAGSAGAQAGQRLRKTDLIRLLTSGRPPGNVALEVRRRCLSFTPSARDRSDLVAAGADSEVLDAMAGCAARTPPPRRAAPGGALRLEVPPQVRAAAGSEVAITVRLLRGGVPQRGVSLALRGATAIPGGAQQDPGAVTDARGVATLHVLAGMETGTYRLSVVSLGELPAQAAVQLVTTVPPLTADVLPGVLVVREGSRAPALVRVVVHGAGGAPVATLPLELRGLTARLAPLAPAETDSTGAALFAIPPGALRSAGTLAVFARGARLATLTARLESPVISDDRTQFIAGTGQRGSVHTTLRIPLAFEVRDTAGAPVTGYGVRFTPTNAQVSPAETATDSSGVARVTVTLGDRAGPVVIAASAGRVQRSTSFYATPGPAQTLTLERDGRPVDSLALATHDPVTLRAVTRDAWGNDALLTGLEASVNGSAARLRDLKGAAAPPGTLVLVPRRSGRATLDVRAAGVTGRLPLQVTLPVVRSGWVYGARAGGAAFNYGFKGAPGVDGRPGFRAELLAGRRIVPGLRVEAGAGLGVLRARDGGASLAVGLLQGLVRGEYALAAGDAGGVVPVISLGGGAYRIKSTDQNNVVYHTSLFWLVGAGIDYPLGPSLLGELRLERQQLYEANSKYLNGSVGALTLLEVGVRVTP